MMTKNVLFRCNGCGKRQDIRNFKYIVHFYKYRGECKVCAAKRKPTAPLRNYSFVDEQPVAPAVYTRLRSQAEKAGFKKTQSLILAKLDPEQRQEYWYCFKLSQYQDMAMLIFVIGLIVTAISAMVGLSILGVTTLFLMWASLHKKAHQAPIFAAIEHQKQVHIETCFLELKEKYLLKQAQKRYG